MTIYLKQHKILFVSAPKIACTSLKSVFFKLENGFDFREFHANGIFRHIHDPSIYPAIQFDRISSWDLDQFKNITLVRDPVRRFISAYSNRVVYYGEAAPDKLNANYVNSRLNPSPDIHEFIERLNEYREASASLKLHTSPLTLFLGGNSKFYDKIFSISEMNHLEKYLSEACGSAITIPKLQTGGPRISTDQLDSREVRKLKQFYENDYKVYGDYFE